MLASVTSMASQMITRSSPQREAVVEDYDTQLYQTVPRSFYTMVTAVSPFEEEESPPESQYRPHSDEPASLQLPLSPTPSPEPPAKNKYVRGNRQFTKRYIRSIHATAKARRDLTAVLSRYTSLDENDSDEYWEGDG